MLFCSVNCQRLQTKKLSDETQKEPSIVTPNSNYKDKYVHLVGHETALDVARRTETNKSYGFGMCNNLTP